MTNEIIAEHLEGILLFAFLGVITHWIAISRGFFQLPSDVDTSAPSVNYKQIFSVFAIYLGTCFFIAPWIASFMRDYFASEVIRSPVAMMGFLQFAVMCIAALLLLLYLLTQDRSTVTRIWKNRQQKNCEPIWYDLALGVGAWFTSFPLIVVIGQLCDLILYLFIGVLNYEQVAVRFLRTSMISPLSIVLALFAILIAAPVIEELLFRGFLQSWLKKHLGRAPAIGLSALAFALFHLAPSQGCGNISLAVPLLVFACYLGFVYERQGSLFASIGLHMTFNAVSSYRILFTPD